MKIVVLEVMTKSGFNFSVEVVGIYGSQKLALEALKELPPESESLMYNIEIFTLNDPPVDILNRWSTEIKELMDMGIIDQLVGEDGKFYYELTPMGKKIVENFPKDHPDQT